MKKLDFLNNRPIAHRGLFNKEAGIPENSIPAFERAISNGYPIEFDVHLLRDGEVVIFHDDSLNRMTNVNKKIKNCTYDEIKKLKLDETNYGIPLFSEVLDLVNGRVPILIELKYDIKVGELEEKVVEALQDYKGKYAIQSFRPSSLIWFKNNYPLIPRGQLSASFNKDSKMIFLKKFVLKNVYLNFLTKPNFISYCIDAFPNKRVEEYRKKGNLVIGWTVRNNSDLRIAKNYCDNVICENFNKINLEIFKKYN